MIKQAMMYGSSVWVSTSVDNLNKVFRLQKRAARVILNTDTRENSVDLFKELSWLPFFHEAVIMRTSSQTFEWGLSRLHV